MLVFVINANGERLMPCSPRKARLLLKSGKAKIVSRLPLAIQLLYGSSGYKQSIDVGVDLGSKHQGMGVTSETHVLMQGEIELRDDVSDNLASRRTLRRSRRNRKTRYRRSKFRHHTKRVYQPDKKKRKWSKVKREFTSPRPAGWLPPSLQSRMNNIFHWIDKWMGLLPNPALHIEVGKFDVQKMMNPDIQRIEYQQGATFGYYDTRYFVFARDQYTCQVCKKKKGKILHTHHLIYHSKGGSDRADNLITVCTECHTNENHKPGGILYEWMQKKKKTKQYKEPPFMNSLRLRVFQRYPNAEITYGSTTTPHRKELGLEKSHANDAIAITGIERITKTADSEFLIRQFRKKKRSLHEEMARKGRKIKNTRSKRNKKNTKRVGKFYLNDRVRVYGTVGYITGFTGSFAYIKDVNGDYVMPPEKEYKQVNLSEVEQLSHHNNWQFIPHFHFV